MDAMLRTRRLVAPLIAVLISALAVLPATAQDAPPDLPPPPDFPPLPIIFTGTAAVDGQPVAQGRLSVRVGDWETGRPVAVENGEFICAQECLIAGPPSFDYIDEPVIFVLDGRYTASLTFPFPNLGSPEQRKVALEFIVAPTPTPSPTPLPTATPTPTPVPGVLESAAPALFGGAVVASLVAVVGIILLAGRIRRRS